LLPDVMFGCLHQALGGGVPAEARRACGTCLRLGGPGRTDGDPAENRERIPFNVMSFHAGGTGARPGSDGLSATAFPSGVKNVPIEVNEAVSPVIVWRKEYRQDSGGPGEFRGGLGQIMKWARSTRRRSPSAPTTTASTIRRAAARRPERRRRHAQARLGRHLARHGPADRGAEGSRDHLDAGRRGARQSAAARGRGGGAGRARGLHLGRVGAGDYGVAVHDDGTVDEAETAKLRQLAAE